MKRIILVMVCGVWGILTCFSQSSELTSEELKFRNGIEQFIKEEGYVPTIDQDDNSINFKKEGESYWINVQNSSPTYVEIHKAGFVIEDTDRSKLLKACNRATMETRCAKAYVTSSSVSFTIEVYCNTISDFRHIFKRSLDALDEVKSETRDFYNE